MTTSPKHTHTIGDRVDMTREELFRDYSDIGTLKNWLYDWHGANEWLFLQVNSIRGFYYDQLMQLITLLGNYRYFAFWIAGLALFAMLSLTFHKLQKKSVIRPRAVVWLGVFVVLMVGFAANGLMVQSMKAYFDYPRPYVAFASENIHLLEMKDADDGLKSFPSGHTAFITFLMASLWPVFRDRWKKWAIVCVALVGWSRVSLGVHFPADVVWSCLMTLVLIIMVRKICYALLFRLFRLSC
jgi:membrane-associated phospholipid phosphatase